MGILRGQPRLWSRSKPGSPYGRQVGEKVRVPMIDDICRWWAAERKSHLPVALALLATCAAVLALGVPRLTMYGHDVFVSLDGGWRVLNGQRPAVDFYAQMGPLYYMLHAAGLALAGGAAEGLGYGTTLAAIVVAAWSFFLLRGRMASLPFAVACLALLMLAIAPFPLGHFPSQTAFAMKHNRYGFALTGLVLLECFLPTSTEDSRRSQFGGGFSSGLACAVLLFLKISYSLVAVLLVAISILLRRNQRVRVAGLLAGALSFVLPMLAYLRFDIPAMVREYRTLAAVQGQRLSAHAIVRRLYLDRFEALPVLLLTMVTVSLPEIAVRRRVALLLACILAIGGGTLLMLTNTQPWGLPLIAVVAILLVNELTLAFRASAQTHIAVMLAFGLLAVAIPLSLDAGGLALALWDKALPSSPGYQFQAAHLSALRFVDLPVPEFANDNGQAFVRYTEEGMELVRAYGHPGESVRGMGMSNPFSYALLRRPSRGGAVNISATNVSSAGLPPKLMLIGDTDLMLVPKFPASERDTLAIVLARYPELLGQDYTMVGESANWKLYRRRYLTRKRFCSAESC